MLSVTFTTARNVRLQWSLLKFMAKYYGSSIEEEFLKVLDWLSPLMFGPKQNDVFEKRQEGTGEWFLQSDEFQHWLGDNSPSCLWCPGPRKFCVGYNMCNSYSDTHLFKLVQEKPSSRMPIAQPSVTLNSTEQDYLGPLLSIIWSN